METLASAAAHCGVAKTTLLRAIKAGKISAHRNEHNEWMLDKARHHGGRSVEPDEMVLAENHQISALAKPAVQPTAWALLTWTQSFWRTPMAIGRETTGSRVRHQGPV
jgi:hypothetical protein